MKFGIASAVLAVMLCSGALVLCAAGDARPFVTMDNDGVIQVRSASQPTPGVSKIWTTNNVPANSMKKVSSPAKFMPKWSYERKVLTVLFVLVVGWFVVWFILACRHTGHGHLPGKHYLTDSRDLSGRNATSWYNWRGPPN